ncbi:MAG: short-chain dehydrogenase/reductase [Flavisolibacter sp.]|nr:short-chain dehydrogenase/reductase [Flavisolibacter sp.]
MKNETTILSLKGKDIWVFGGAGYLGQATIKLLVAAGAQVLCIDLDDRSQHFISTEGLSKQVRAATLDIYDCGLFKDFVANGVKETGIPHGVVNLTYASTAKKLDELTEQDFDRVSHGSLTSSFLLAREVGARMAEAGRGSMVLFSSMYGSLSPDPALYEEPMNKNPIEYGVTKAGIIQMVRYLAVHWGRNNVRFNAISPGPFPNPDVEQKAPEFMKRLSNKTPLGRVGKSSEIAGAVAFLLSDAASYITGQNLHVDGGWNCW